MDLLSGNVEQHLIRKNHTRSYPDLTVYLDTESKWIETANGQDHTLRMAWACYHERRREGRNPTEQWAFFEKPYPFLNWLVSKARPKKPLWVFGHNIYFDLQLSCAFELLPHLGWTLDFIYDKGLVFILVIRKGQESIKFISTTNYFQMTVEDLGEIVGMKKLKVDFSAVTDEELKIYCRRDVEIIKKAMEYYFDCVQSHDLGRFGMTRAAQSFNCYRHRFMKNRIQTHQEETLIDLEKQAYMGGRVECFFIGEPRGGPFLTLDINSLYPYIMSTKLFPCKFVSYTDDLSVSALYAAKDRFAMVAECFLETNIPRYAVRKNGKIVFPVGRFRAFLCTGGIQAALRDGHLKKIIRIAFYKQADLFSEYIKYFYDLRIKYRKEGNKVFDHFMKYFMNSLYGKFAQWRPVQNWTDEKTGPLYDRTQVFDEVTGENMVEYKLMNRRVTVSGNELARNSLIPISAHITEYARILLDSIVEGVSRRRVIYCDTDSIMIRKKHLVLVRHPISDKVMGALKVEKEFDSLHVYGPKSYVTEKETVLKGVPKSAKEIKPMVFEYTGFPKMATHMRKGIVDRFQTVRVRKEILGEYDKGTVTPSGVVFPFRFAESQPSAEPLLEPASSDQGREILFSES